ncbi:S9 family peptidase [Permianibacter sp. IMCC34836]|nr:S9 family peptidase [Permianibacter fluminis]
MTLTALGLVGCERGDEPAPETTTPVAQASAKAREIKQYSAAMLYETVSYGGSSINAAGDAVLLHSDESGVFNVYRVALASGEKTALTDSKDDALFAESFFPADDRVLYSGDKGGNELDHLFVRALDGSITDLTPGDKLKAQFIRFSKDGKSFYVMTNERDAKFFDVYKYDSANYRREMVYKNDAGMQPEALSGDGRWLALNRSNNNADSDIFVVDLSSKDKKLLHLTPHEGFVQYSAATFTPDNFGLIYTTDANGEFAQAIRYNMAGGKRDTLINAEWDVSFVYFSDDGRYMISGINADGSTEVRILDTVTNKALPLPEMPKGDLRSISFSKDSKRMVFYVNSDTSPSNLYVYNMDGKAPQQLTQALPKEVAELDLVKSDVVRYPSTDNLEIPALLFRPQTANADSKVPAIVYIHGGPGGQTRKGYNPTIQHLVNHGYAVIGVNNRGSSGYGKTFYHLDDKKHGEKDLEDIVAAKKYLQSLPWVDGDRIAVMGGSYGGYLTMAAMTYTDEFAVGIDIFGVTNWVRTLESIPPWWASFRDSLYAEMGDPAKDKERLRRISPLFHADNIKKPVLVIQGANDPRVLQAESDEMVAAIRANNVPVEYVLFPDEGHGFVKKNNRIRASDSYLLFLDTYLKGQGPVVPAAPASATTEPAAAESATSESAAPESAPASN